MLNLSRIFNNEPSDNALVQKLKEQNEQIAELLTEISELKEELIKEHKMRTKAEEVAEELRKRDVERERERKAESLTFKKMKERQEKKDFVLLQVLLNTDMPNHQKKRFESILSEGI